MALRPDIAVTSVVGFQFDSIPSFGLYRRCAQTSPVCALQHSSISVAIFVLCRKQQHMLSAVFKDVSHDVFLGRNPPRHLGWCSMSLRMYLDLIGCQIGKRDPNMSSLVNQRGTSPNRPGSSSCPARTRKKSSSAELAGFSGYSAGRTRTSASSPSCTR